MGHQVRLTTNVIVSLLNIFRILLRFRAITHAVTPDLLDSWSKHFKLPAQDEGPSGAAEGGRLPSALRQAPVAVANILSTHY